MTKPNRTISQAKQSPPPLAQQREIAAQTAAFLAGGGTIQQIPRGISGQPKLGGPSLTAPQPSKSPQAPKSS